MWIQIPNLLDYDQPTVLKDGDGLYAYKTIDKFILKVRRGTRLLRTSRADVYQIPTKLENQYQVLNVFEILAMCSGLNMELLTCTEERVYAELKLDTV